MCVSEQLEAQLAGMGGGALSEVGLSCPENRHTPSGSSVLEVGGVPHMLQRPGVRALGLNVCRCSQFSACAVLPPWAPSVALCGQPAPAALRPRGLVSNSVLYPLKPPVCAGYMCVRVSVCVYIMYFFKFIYLF